MIEGILQQEPNYDLAAKMLEATTRSHEAYASNIANAHTPNYLRIEVARDFQAELNALAKQGDISGIQNLPVKLSVDKMASKDENGNSVNFEHELMGMKENLIKNEFLTQVLSTSFRRLETAITGHQKF